MLSEPADPEAANMVKFYFFPKSGKRQRWILKNNSDKKVSRQVWTLGPIDTILNYIEFI